MRWTAGEEEFGISRLTEAVQEHAAKTAQELINEILRAVEDFTNGAPQFDDMTLMVVKRNA